jgi:NADP-dependent 3-hydroxy acid dehydrogenase YdfG
MSGNTTNLKDKTALVTGASSGIGRSVALGLAAQGASLRLVGRDRARLDAVASIIMDNGGDAKTHEADLSLDEDLYRLAEEIKSDLRNIDILVHSAGAFSMGPIVSAPVADFDRQYRVNVRAPYLLTQLILPMIKPHGGQIVFINSSAGLKARAGVSQYAATKHALRAVADSLREEVNANGVRVISIYPGRTSTPMQETVHEMEGRVYDPDHFMRPEDIAVVVINSLALPGSAEVTDVSVRPRNK